MKNDTEFDELYEKFKEQECRKCLESYKRLADNLPGIAFTVLLSEEKRTLFLNDKLKPMTGYDSEELKNGNVCNIETVILPEDLEKTLDAVNSSLVKRKPYDVEYRIIHKDGKVRYFNERGQPVYGPDGEPVSIDGVIFDISDRKQAEERLKGELYNLELHVDKRTDELKVQLLEHKSIANALQESEARVQAILDNTTAVIYVKDLDGKYLLINRCYERLFHIDKEKIAGKTDYDIFPKEMAEPFRSNDLKVIGENGPVEFEEVVPHDDGLHTYISIKFPLYNSAGDIYAVCGISTDITGRKKADDTLIKSEKLLKEAQKVAQMGHWELDLKTGTLYWSDEVYNIFGVGHEEFEDTYEAFLSSVHPEDKDYVNSKYTDSLKNHEDYNIVHRIIMKDGVIKYINEKCLTEYNDAGEPLRSVGTALDITELKLAEEEKERASAMMAAAMVEKEAAEQSSRLKSDFLANMSHELRTPLNVIIGFSQIMKDGLSGELSEQQKEYCNDIYCSGEHLLAIINDILDLSRIEAGKVFFEPEMTDVKVLLSSSLPVIKEKALAHRIELTLDVDGEIGSAYIDARKFRQIIYNLLSNAVKFTPDGGKVSLSARTSGPDSARMLDVSVADTGIGISGKDQKRLFRSFEQLDKVMTKKHGGTGLGLMLTKKLTELHGGTVVVESDEGKGSTFTFSIPYRESL